MWQSLSMNSADTKLVGALLHHVNIIFSSDAPENVGREGELDNIRECAKLAENVVNGTATDDDKASAADLVHPQVSNTYGL